MLIWKEISLFEKREKMKEIMLEILEKALRKSWSAETSSDPKKWTPENPAWGQCAVTALVVQDYFGGELLRFDLLGIGSHYFNQLPDSSEIDLTSSQFTEDMYKCILEHAPKETRTREYVLSYPDTVKRYEILKQRVENNI